MDLDLVRLECEVVADITDRLVAALYGALRDYSASFRESCCPNLQKDCISCSDQLICPYTIVFGQQLSSDSEIVRRHQKPPLPFSQYIDMIAADNSSCTVGIVVVGSAVNYLELFHAALFQLVESTVNSVQPAAKFTVRSYSLDYQGVRHEIAHSTALTGSVILLSGQHILLNTVHSDSVTLIIKSPLRLLSNGSVAHRFDFSMFFRSQLRRCSSLYAYYGTGELDLDYTRLSEAAQNVAVFDDKILYTQPLWSRRLNRAGLSGTAECVGLVEPMFSLLLLGSYFNAGKGASFGSGFYKLEES